ncbi:hypothetical protein ISG33_04260 [Glaciecola sp. MH2013]|uniref:hypothetical protein n=1 Tax=Glaciecola sp. MH2013 TaxID=2785524 RepID=UPI00189ECCA8|nr:hypothetical protein [Glaciecola sp. MH2013]MBF7072611.1 hypothetical protein [Glaciecola sp. MH2013]
MAITACPSCKKPISDKSKVCSHCGFDIGNATAEDLERKANFARFQKMHNLQNQSLIAIFIFLAGIGFLYWGGSDPGDTPYNLSIAAAVVGFAWYAINRVRIVLAKRN